MMKPCAYEKQGLVDHSIGSYTVLEGKVSESYYKVISRRLERYGITLNPNVVKEIVKDVVVLHDIGKAGEYYQNQFDDNCNPLKSNFSFIYHELGSALFFYYDYEIVDLEKVEEVRSLLTLAVLNHLNAIRGISDYSLNKFPDKFDDKMIKLSKYGSVLLEKLREKDLVSKSLRVRDYDFTDYNDMLNAFSRKSDKYLKLYNLFLAPVMMGDNLDSSLVRNTGSKTRFVRILEGELNGGSTL
ncbi:CRISPR-associated endonuclease Cas3'' [Acidianus sulfidivorans JP7]|uniref:CRISPR-associated endonuclease Cas3 n=1 Tax=Acidianus sulfidivorans JP7 TaxID=619593 RepID=A0A2U9IPX9_9CREN|nr:CRISPR-associated endonuclease Cas3'' [Acidianus sulfidivorans]AWR98109.1 CRISPR-associated endonuclease Cas3'' [Acidianus sulfidivorans JP7]